MSKQPLYALTMHRPLAWAVMHGKDVENRDWAPRLFRGGESVSWVGQVIAIHAGKRPITDSDMAEVREVIPDVVEEQVDLYAPEGCILGTALINRVTYVPENLTDDEKKELGLWSPWLRGPVAWWLSDIVRFPEAVGPVRGYPKLWRVPGSVVQECRAQYANGLEAGVVHAGVETHPDVAPEEAVAGVRGDHRGGGA